MSLERWDLTELVYVMTVAVQSQDRPRVSCRTQESQAKFKGLGTTGSGSVTQSS